MDAVRFGLGIRALRRRRGWRQEDLAAAVGVSQAEISRLERGERRRPSVDLLEKVAAGLGARVEVRLAWQGEALDRLLDAAHAAVVEDLVKVLNDAGWECRTEVTFNHDGERGSVDVLARQPETAAILVCEAKSVVPDLQAMQASLDRKVRLAARMTRDLGWETPSIVGRLLAVREARTARRRVAEHEATFAASFPARAREVRRWLARPSGAIRGLVFLPGSLPVNARQRYRVRLPQAPAAPSGMRE